MESKTKDNRVLLYNPRTVLGIKKKKNLGKYAVGKIVKENNHLPHIAEKRFSQIMFNKNI